MVGLNQFAALKLKITIFGYKEIQISQFIGRKHQGPYLLD